jgi:hypothetical protein
MPIRKSAKTGKSPGTHAARRALQGATKTSDPVVVPSRGGNLLSLYFTKSFKRRKRPRGEARYSTYKKGDLTTRREPDFGLASDPSPKASRPPAFSAALRRLRED